MRSIDDLVTETDRFVVRLSVCHEDLLTHVRRGDADALKTWQEVKLEGLRESLATVGRYRIGRASGLEDTFQRYARVAGELIEDVRADDRVGAAARQAALTEKYAAARAASDRVIRKARVWKGARSVGAWLGAALTAAALAVVAAEYQLRLRIEERLQEQRTRDAEERESLDLERGADCTVDDWAQAGPIDRSTVSCLAWSMHAWRTAHGYELTASLTVQGGAIVRTRTRWIDAKGSAAREYGGPDGPAAELSTWVCKVPKGAEIRLVVWWRHPTHRSPVTAHAYYVTDDGKSPC
jgi:hypothetical protein